MKNLDTLCVRAGYEPKSGEPQVVPIVQSTTYYYEKASDLADLFDLKKDGYFYSRLANPTNDALEKKVAALEGGTVGIALSSGMAAITMAVLNVCSAGDNLVCSQAIYGGTFNLFKNTLKKYGITTRFIDQDASSEEIEAQIDDNTKLIYAETVANPAISILDFDKFSKIAQKHKILFMVDNTLTTPILCRPKEFGANVIVHSSSKYLDGHAAALGGIIVDCGNFDFTNNERYKEFNVPDESYHGLVYASLKGSAFGVKARVQMIRDIGAIMAPQNAYITNLGVETLSLRMERTVYNASMVAKFLNDHDMVLWVKHPSLVNDKYHDLAKKYMPNGVTGMLSFGIKGGRENAALFMEKLKMISIVTHVADVRSCVLHPASTTHRQMSEENLVKAGIADNLVRLSIGIENYKDIIEDIKQALEEL